MVLDMYQTHHLYILQPLFFSELLAYKSATNPDKPTLVWSEKNTSAC